MVHDIFWMLKIKVKYTLVQILRLCTDRTAHRGSRGLALLFLDQGPRSGWGVSVTLRPLLTPGKDQVLIVQGAWWAPGPVWRGAENHTPTGICSRTVQPVACFYTNWSTGPNTSQWLNIYIYEIPCLRKWHFCLNTFLPKIRIVWFVTGRIYYVYIKTYIFCAVCVTDWCASLEK
jgi:hypothetical protein